jgi:hypothetical protein
LIDVWVDFLADLFARLQAHDHELGMRAGEQDLPEVGIREGLALDRSNVHRCTLLLANPIECAGPSGAGAESPTTSAIIAPCSSSILESIGS